MTRRRAAVLTATALLLSLLAAAPAGARLDAIAEAKRITDPTGDSGAAPDIRHVDVGNDVGRGPVVIWIETPNRPKLVGDDMLAVFLDTDLNPATGENGVDHVIAGDASGALLLGWNGAELAQVPAPTLRLAQRDTWVRISIHPSDLGGTRAFNYFVVSSNGDDLDVSPDGDGIASYSLASGPLKLSVDGFALSPTVLRAGARTAAVLLVARHDTAELLADGSVACTVKLGKTTLASRKGRRDEAAFCTFTVPRAARGSVVSVRLATTYGGTTVSRTWTGRVR